LMNESSFVNEKGTHRSSGGRIQKEKIDDEKIRERDGDWWNDDEQRSRLGIGQSEEKWMGHLFLL